MAEVDPVAAIAAIDAAMASGELSIEYAGRRVTYRSIDDLLKARDQFERERTKVAPGQPASAERARTSYATFSRD